MDEEPVHLHHIPGLIKQILNCVYNTDDLIGTGSFSVVYKGIDSRNNEPVAIKVIDRNSIANEIDDMLLHNEVNCHKIISHENIVKTLDLCKTARNIYIICEYCSDGDLYNYVKNKGKLSEDQAINLITQITKAVNHVHSKRIIHRDIKSANILLKNGIVKLGDFGFAEFIGHDFAKGLYSVGSPIYMSPQAFADSEYSYQSDTWSIGIIFYEMLIGYQPFNGIEFETFLLLFISGEVYKPVMNNSPFVRMLLRRILEMNPLKRIDTNQMLNLLSQRHTWKEAPPQMPMNGLQKQNGFNEFGPMTYPLGPPIGYGPQIFPQPQQYPPQPGRNQPNIEPPSVFPQIGLPRPTSVPNFKVQSPPPPPQIPQMRPPPMRIPNRPMMPPPNALPRRGMM